MLIWRKDLGSEIADGFRLSMIPAYYIVQEARKDQPDCEKELLLTSM